MNFTTASLKTAFSKQISRFSWVLVLLLAFSCNKPGNDYLISGAGKGLLGVHQTDTISLNMVTDYYPLIPEAQNLTVYNIGTVMDPLFGRTTAGAFAAVQIGSSNAPTWGPASSMDSVVLSVKVSDLSPAIGSNHFSGQTWHLFKMASGFGNYGTNGTANYPSDTNFKTSIEIGHGIVRYNPGDSVVTLSIAGPQLQAFRDSLFDSTGNSSLFTDPTEFGLLMHGILILPDSSISGGGNLGEIAPFNFQDTTHTRLTIYYNAGKSWYMFMNNGPLTVNVYNHNYYNSPAWKNNMLAGKSVDKAYLQSMGGMKCIVTMPYLANLVKDSMLAINQAEFIFPKVDSAADPFNGNNPPKLLFRPRAHNGTDSVAGFTDDITDYFQQNYQSNSKSYNYLMTRYIQTVLFNDRQIYNGNKTFIQRPVYGINLSVTPDNPHTPGRVLLYTQHTGNKANRPKLVITYTKIVDKK